MSHEPRMPSNSFESVVWIATLYRVIECGEQIPTSVRGTRYTYIDRDLEQLLANGCLAYGLHHFEPTDEGRRLLARVLSVLDAVRRFEIFGLVRVTRALTPEEGERTYQEGDQDGSPSGPILHVYDHVYDPRFRATDDGRPVSDPYRLEGVEDLRLGMYEWLGERMCTEFPEGARPDAHQVVFLQQLLDGKLRDESFWFRLENGEFGEQIGAIVSSAYGWRDVAGSLSDYEGDERAREAVAHQIMEVIYTAGLLEQRKREGFECSACGVPLGVFDANHRANNDGQPLTHCPNPDCGADFRPPPPSGDRYECPQCSSEVYRSMRQCGGCGAYLDFSLPEGAVEQRTTVTREVSYEPVFGYVGGYWAYGYRPYGWWNPWNPLVDIAVIGLLYCDPWDRRHW